MGRLSARTIEALAGGTLGAGVLASVGALTHAPKTPLEWTGDDEKFHSRKRTLPERKERMDRALKASLLGLGVGAAASLGAGHLRRASISSREFSELDVLLKERLGGLQNIVRRAEKQVENLPPSIKGSKQFAGRGDWLRRAQTLHAGEEKTIRDLVEVAKENRKSAPWGGFQMGRGPLPTKHETLTHEGLVSRRYLDRQHADKLPPFTSPYDKQEPGEQFFRSILQKTAASMCDELLAIRRARNSQ